LRFLIFGINYYPELTGIGKYTAEMCEWLTSKGYEVSVITANPYYPEWKIFSEYKNSFSKGIKDKVKIYRNPLYIPSTVSGKKRILHEMSFILSSSVTWIKFLFKKRYDIIVCIAPPFHLGFFGLIYKKIRGGLLVYHIQDLQVDAAKELELIKSRTLLRWITVLEKYILKKVDIITTISQGMKMKIEQKKIQKDVFLVPNWVDTQFIKPLPRTKSLREALGYSNTDFLILYSGNLGEKQGLEVIVQAAKSLESEQRIKFLICGNGVFKARLKTLANECYLKNVKFIDLLPYDKLPQLLNSADVHLILQKLNVADLVLPSKLTGIVSSGGASIVTASPGTTLYETVKKHKLGKVIDPENVDSLVNAINECMISDITEYKTCARNYAEEFLNKDRILGEFIKVLKQ